MVNLRIECPAAQGHKARVYMDDKEISSCLYGVDLHLDVNEANRVTLYAYAERVDVVGDVEGRLEVIHHFPESTPKSKIAVFLGKLFGLAKTG